MKTVKDPHHDGSMLWGWDGVKLYTKLDSTVVKRWQEVKRIHPTPKRIAVLYALMHKD
ncbi:TPA: hypothetical protein ACSJ5D_002789 [Yersinia enterocolitica]